MHSKTVRRALRDISENIGLAKAFVSHLTFQEFQADIRSIYAETRCLEIISEATRRLGDDILAKYPTIGWQKVRSAGNLYRHEYDNVSPRVLWNTVEDALDELERMARIEIAIGSTDPDAAVGSGEA